MTTLWSFLMDIVGVIMHKKERSMLRSFVGLGEKI